MGARALSSPSADDPPANARPLRICFVAPLAYPVLNTSCVGPIGGSEVRAILLARELAKKDRFEVHVVTLDHGQPRREVRDGIVVHSRQGETPPVLPAAAPAWFTRAGAAQLIAGSGSGKRALGRIVRAAHRATEPVRMRLRRWRERDSAAGFIGEYPMSLARLALYEEIDADVYAVAPGGLFESAEVAFFCRRRNRRYVFLAASDVDYDARHRLKPAERGVSGLPGYVHLFAIENAVAHVVQSEEQSRALREGFGRSSFVVRNPVDTSSAFPSPQERRAVLWVGKSSPEKRPDLLVAIAERLPEQPFVVVMNHVIESIDVRCRGALLAMRNVTVLERVPPPEIERYYAEAGLLLNTSDTEGFPNAFLQAAKYGVPVVSLRVDPGGMLSKHGCGIACGGDVERAVRDVRTLIASPDRWREISVRCIGYVRQHHDKNVIVEELERILLAVRDASPTAQLPKNAEA